MCGGGGEAGHDVRAGHAPICGAGQQVAGVVVEPVQDLDAASIGQGPVREVGLPALVGLLGGKAVIGAFGAFTRLRGDQAVMVQDAPGWSRSTAPAGPVGSDATAGSSAPRRGLLR